MPKVSVIIPTYNRASMIERALLSAQNQTLKDIEIFICDDASTDKTGQVVKPYLEKDTRIKWLINPKNQGPGAARNLGLKAAQGDYIAFLDSDDEWLPDKLAKQVERMEKEPPEIGVCFCGAKIIKNGDTHHPAFYSPRKAWERDTLRQFVLDKIGFLTPIVLFRRICLMKAGLVAEFRDSEDDEFLQRIFFDFQLAVIPEVLALVHLDTSLNKNAYEYKTKALENYLRHYDRIREELGWRAAVYFKGRRYTNLLVEAIHERKSAEVMALLKKRFRLIPFLWPNEIISIAKAFFRILSQRSRSD